jgi:hypothetical protein
MLQQLIGRSSLYILGMDRMEDNATNSSPIDARVRFAAAAYLSNRYLTMTVYSRSTIPAFSRHVTI